ncbi:hypothetical protein Mapa_007094 [Marchantia paleacea]|nr:hypothetical protein Mapa_007094 [Marchantia paleacea]
MESPEQVLAPSISAERVLRMEESQLEVDKGKRYLVYRDGVESGIRDLKRAQAIKRFEHSHGDTSKAKIKGSLWGLSVLPPQARSAKNVQRVQEQVFGNFWSVPPLRWATITGNISAMMKLRRMLGDAAFLELLNLVTTSEEGMNCLHLAANRGQCTEINKLFQHWGRRLREIVGRALQRAYGDVLSFLLSVPAIDLNAIDGDGNTALILASSCGHWEVVDILLEASAHTGVLNRRGLNCLHAAVSEGHVSVVKKLLEKVGQTRAKFVNSKARGDYEWTALHYAVARNRIQVLRLLLDDPNVDVDAQDGKKCTALFIASKLGNLSAVTALLMKGANRFIADEERRNCLHIAAGNGYIDVLKELQSSSDLDLDDVLHGTTEFFIGAKAQDDDELVSQIGTEEDALEKSPDRFFEDHEGQKFGFASEFNRSSRNRIDPDVLAKSRRTSELLIEAASKGRDDVVLWLLEGVGLHVDAEGEEKNTASLIEFEKGHTLTVEMLSGFGVNVDVQDEEGNTALMLACKKGHTSTVDMLLRRGADILVSNKEGLNCVHQAAIEGFSDVLKVLLEDDGDEEYWNGESLPLDLSADPGRFSIRLEAMGMKSKAHGYTLLHMAARGGHPITTVVQLLGAYIILNLKVRGFNRHPRDQLVMPKFLQLVTDEVASQQKAHFHSKGARYDGFDAKGDGARESSGGDDLASESSRIYKTMLAHFMSERDDMEWRENFLASSERYGGYRRLVQEFVDAYMSSIVFSNEKDERQRTFLHYIAERSVVKNTSSCTSSKCPVESLLKFVTIDVHAADQEGETPLHIMTQQGDLCMLRHIFESGRTPDMLLRNVKGESPCNIVWIKCWSHMFRGGEHIVSKCHNLVGDEERDCDHCATWKFLEAEVLTKFLADDSKPNVENIISGFLRYLREDLEKRRIQECSVREEFHKDRHSGGLTLLHYLAFRGLATELQELLLKKKFRRLINRRYDCNGQTALHFAIVGRNIDCVKVLLEEKLVRRNVEDGLYRTPCELLSEIPQSPFTSTVKDIEALMLQDDDVKVFMDKQYRDRQVHVDAGNTALVGAALIASVTFVGWLQAPLGYTQDQQLDSQEFSAIEQHTSVQVFWLFNSLSFFYAIATLVSGAGAVLPAPHGQFIAKEVRLMRMRLVLTSFLLVISIVCVLCAFTAAGVSALPPISKYRKLMIATSLGGVVCVFVICAYFRQWIDILSRDSSRFCLMFQKTMRRQGAEFG